MELPWCLPFNGPTNVDLSPSDTVLLFHKSNSLRRCPLPSGEVSGSVPVFIADHFSSADEGEGTRSRNLPCRKEPWSGIPHPPYPASM